MNPVQRTNDKQNNADTNMFKFAVVDSIGTALLGLGLYGQFVGDGNTLLPFLHNKTVVFALIGAGIVIMAWGGINLLTAIKQKASQKPLS